MMRKAFWKDVRQSIVKSKARFFSILTIIALGVGFFAGINATEPDMILSADQYFNEKKLSDFRIMAPLGFESDDIEKVKALDGVKEVQEGYSKDLFLTTENGNTSTVRLYSFNPEIHKQENSLNQLTLIKGRFPENPGEIVIGTGDFSSSELAIGKKLTATVPNEEELEDSLKTDEFTVVGLVLSPLYISYERGQTNIGDGSIGYYAYINENDFNVENPTEIYVRTTKSDTLLAYSKEYENHITSIKENLEDLGTEIASSDIKELKQEIADAKIELEENKEKANQELADAEQELKNAEIELENAEKELEENEVKNTSEITNARKQLQEGRKQLEEGKRLYQENLVKWEKGYQEYEQGLNELNKAKKELDDAGISINEGEKQLQDAYSQLESGEGQLLALEATIHELEKLVEILMTSPPATASDYEWLIRERKLFPEDLYHTLLSDEILGEDGYTVEDIPMIIGTLQFMVEETKTAYEEAEKIYEEGLTAYQENKQAFEEAKAQYEQGLKEYETGARKLDRAKEELDEGKKQLDAAKAELEASEKQLISGEQELNRQEQELQNALAEGRQEIEKGKKELQEGWETFYQEKEDALKQIAEAEEEIKEAEETIEDIPDEWFIFTRDANPGYSGYGDDAERIGAVAKVFPLFFFLVAALVSLTTMTRMVEEERVQIGTLKALGYGTLTIASKYLFYALLTSLFGAIIGLAIGYQLFPYAIMSAYGIMYDIPNLVTVFHLDYTIISLAIAILTTTLATLVAVFSELKSTPAALMQPKAPKPGKRIFLERITPLWSRLSFSQKVSFRNIFRYKRRFWMTVLGISGCTALLLTGFGLSDSINDIVGKQFSNIFVYDGQVIMNSEDATEEEIESLFSEEQDVDSYLKIQTETVDAMVNNTGRTYEANLMIPENKDDFSTFIQLRERITQESFDLPEKGAVISEKLARLLEINVGDSITYRDTDNNSFEVEIVGIAENYLSHYIYLTPEYYESVSQEKPEFNSALFTIKNKEEFNQSAFKEKIMEHDSVLAVILTQEIADTFNDTMGSLNSVISILIIAAGLLAFVVLYNLTNINITERIREIATIKVLGFRNLEVDAYIYRENIFLTLIGTGVGLVLGVILHKYVIDTMEIDSMMFGQHAHLTSYIWSIILTLVFSMLVNLFMHKKLKNVNMVESLKSVE